MQWARISAARPSRPPEPSLDAPGSGENQRSLGRSGHWPGSGLTMLIPTDLQEIQRGLAGMTQPPPESDAFVAAVGGARRASVLRRVKSTTVSPGA